MKGMIGLEIHVYLVTKEKLFCRCRASREKGLKPNTLVCPICTGMPGAKPMLPNEEAVRKAIQIALMLNCKVNEEFYWQRKHYDWPDLPKGYQNTISGANAIPVGVDGEFFGIKVDSMHLEEDPASWEPSTGKVDYNRSGIPLVEIVTAPDFTFSEEVVEWLKKLVHTLSYLKAADKNAGVKVDVNVNIPGKTERVEIKNVNSFENIKRAIEVELERQAVEGSVRETRRFDDKKGKTIRMRGKEDAMDYRFIREPDLPGVKVDKRFIDDLRKSLPESPYDKLDRMIKKYKLRDSDAEVLTKNIDIAEFFEKVAEKVGADFAVSWVNVELLRVLNYNKKSFDEVNIKEDHFVRLLEMVKSGKVTELQAKQILNKFVPSSFDPSNTKGKIDDASELRKVIEKVIRSNSKAVSDYKNGDSNALNFLMGQVMKETERRADYKVAKRILEEVLVK